MMKTWTPLLCLLLGGCAVPHGVVSVNATISYTDLAKRQQTIQHPGLVDNQAEPIGDDAQQQYLFNPNARAGATPPPHANDNGTAFVTTDQDLVPYNPAAAATVLSGTVYGVPNASDRKNVVGTTVPLEAIAFHGPKVANARIRMIDGRGLVLADNAGTPLIDTTDGYGIFVMPQPAQSQAVVVVAELSGGQGNLRRILPAGSTAGTVDVDLASTLVAAFFMEGCANGCPDPAQALNRVTPAQLVQARGLLLAAQPAPPAPDDLNSDTLIQELSWIKSTNPALADLQSEVMATMLGDGPR